MKRLCILHANCQGDPLAFLLRAVPEFDERYEIRRFVNYLREPIADDLLRRCSVFLFQPLGESWDELATSRLAEKLPHGAVCLQLPNMFFKGYWPFWTSASRMAFGDSFLDKLISQGLSMAEAMHVYLRGRALEQYDFAAMAEESLAREREKERNAVVGMADLVAKHWRERQMFTTVNHPARELIVRMADAVLERLNCPPVSEAARLACPQCGEDDFELPIHPVVGQRFNLPFVTEHRVYNVYGRPLTFAQYAACYMDCSLQGLDFVSYLHAVAD